MKSLDETLSRLFGSGNLVRPSYQETNFIDLVRALAVLAGIPDVPATPRTSEIVKDLGNPDHLVFILIDGLGIELLEHLPPSAFLRRHLVREMRTVFPSTTATALTSLATGLWPSEHSIPGWWTRLEKYGLNAVILPFVERGTERPLTELGVEPREVFPAESIWSEISRCGLNILPSDILGTVYSRYASGEIPGAGYERLEHAIQLTERTVKEADSQSFTYLYLPHLDSICHQKGTTSPEIYRLLTVLDDQIRRLTDSIKGRGSRVVITADHGLVDVPRDRTFVLSAEDPVRASLQCAPTGEPAVPVFHVRPGQEETFSSEFENRFGEYFVLLTAREAEALRLFGPDKLSETMRLRLGTHIGIPLEPAKLYTEPCEECHPEHIGLHGGLSTAEMITPLIVA